MKRREFIKLSSVASAGAVVSPALMLGGCASKPLPGTGTVTSTPTVCDMCFWKCAGDVCTAADACARAVPVVPARTSIPIASGNR